MEEKRYSKLALERIATGDAPMPGNASTSELLRKRIDELHESNQAILAEYPPETVAREIEQRLKSGGSDVESMDSEGPNIRPFRSVQSRRILLFAAAAVIALGGIIPGIIGRIGQEPASSIRIKGLDPSISIYRQAGSDAGALEPRARVSENDVLQIAYIAAGKSYGAILSIDGRGIVTVHFPYQSTEASRLESDGEVALDHAYRLDDAPRFERFFFLTSDKVFTLDMIMKSAESLAKSATGGMEGELNLPSHIEQYSVALVKEVSR